MLSSIFNKKAIYNFKNLFYINFVKILSLNSQIFLILIFFFRMLDYYNFLNTKQKNFIFCMLF